MWINFWPHTEVMLLDVLQLLHTRDTWQSEVVSSYLFSFSLFFSVSIHTCLSQASLFCILLASFGFCDWVARRTINTCFSYFEPSRVFFFFLKSVWCEKVLSLSCNWIHYVPHRHNRKSSKCPFIMYTNESMTIKVDRFFFFHIYILGHVADTSVQSN